LPKELEKLCLKSTAENKTSLSAWASHINAEQAQQGAKTADGVIVAAV